MNRVGSAPLDVRLDLQIAETRVWTLKSRKHRRRTPFEVQEAPEVLRFGRIGNPKAIKKEKSRLREQLVVHELWKELSLLREILRRLCRQPFEKGYVPHETLEILHVRISS